MVGEHSITKVAVVGNTRLTLKGLCALRAMSDIDVKIILGLDTESATKKANYTPLENFLSSYSYTQPPILLRSKGWEDFKERCQNLGINLIILLGDSRIVPEDITESFNIIGNHGAVLPHVQGGGSLVWGRLLNSGEWGISIMEIDKKVDSGIILKVKKFKFNHNCTEIEFTEKCDDLTIDALVEVLLDNYTPHANQKWDVKISKHTDSAKTIDILQYCLNNNLNVYLPPRTPADGVLKAHWSDDFKDIFKIANDIPYPRWISEG